MHSLPYYENTLQKKLQEIAVNHSSDINFKGFKEHLKSYTK